MLYSTNENHGYACGGELPCVRGKEGAGNITHLSLCPLLSMGVITFGRVAEKIIYNKINKGFSLSSYSYTPITINF